MYDYFFTFRSATAAQGGAKRLEQAGIPAMMVRTPRNLQKQGCGYSLRVRAAQYRAAQQLLVQGGAGFQRIYTRLPDGNWEEVRA